jgi:DNA-directed RNA polymerase specialized sigma24 family protein
MMTRDEYGQAYQQGFDVTIRLLRSRGAPRDCAREVAQAAWARGWERLSQLRNDSLVVTWVNTIALNVYRSVRRSESSCRTVPELCSKPGVNLAAIDMAHILKHCRPCERLLLEQQMCGISAVEIARQQGVTETVIRMRLIRACRAARSRMENPRGGFEKSTLTSCCSTGLLIRRAA